MHAPFIQTNSHLSFRTRLGDLIRPCGTVFEPGRVRVVRVMRVRVLALALALALARARIHIQSRVLRRGPAATIVTTIPEDNNTNNTNSRSRPCLGPIIAGNLAPQSVPRSLHSDNHIDQLRATVTQAQVQHQVRDTVTVLTVAKEVTSTASKAVLLLPRGPPGTCKCARCASKRSARSLLLQTSLRAINGPVTNHTDGWT